MALATNPSIDFSSNWLEFAGDFTGDGWPDVLLASTSGTTAVRESERRAAPVGFVPRTSFRRRPRVAEVSVMKDIDGDGKPDLVYMGGGAMRWAKPDPANPTGPWLSTQVGEQGTYVGARHRRGRHQRRRPRRHPQRLRMVGATRARPTRRCGRTIPQAVRPSERPRRARRRRDVRVRRQRRRAQRRRDVAAGARVRARVVRAEARRGGQDHVRAAHDLGRLRVEERRRRDLLRAARLDLRRHGRRRHSRLRRRQTVLLASARATPIPIPTARRCSTSTGRCATRQAPGGAEFVPELVHNRRARARRSSRVDLNKDGVNDIVTSGELGAFVFLGKPRAKK